MNKTEVIRDIAYAISSTCNHYSITNLALDLILEYTGARRGSVFLATADGNLDVIASRGLPHQIANSARIKIGNRICGRIAAQHSPLLVKRRDKKSYLSKKHPDRYETESFICTPIIMRGELVGVINISEKVNKKDFTEDEFDLVNIIAAHLATAIGYANLKYRLRNTMAEIDAKNMRLLDRDRQNTEFMAAISHDLRTPVNSIKGAAHYLSRGRNAEGIKNEFINIISEESDRLTSALDRLLDVLFKDQQETLSKRKLVNARQILEDAVSSEIIRKSINEKNVSIYTTYDGHHFNIIGEKESLLRAFINILYGLTGIARANTSIEVLTKATKKCVKMQFRLRDHQLSASVINNLFDERYIWLSHPEYKNTLKFLLARKIIEAERACISVSSPRKGLKFTVSFPLNQYEYRNAKIDELVQFYVTFIAESMGLKRCSLMLYDTRSKRLVIRSAVGVEEEVIRQTRLKPGNKISGKVLKENRPLFISDIETGSLMKTRNNPKYFTRSLISIPVTLNNKAVGVLNLNNKADGSEFNEMDFHIATVIAKRISLILEKMSNGSGDEEFRSLSKGLKELISAGRHYSKKDNRITDLVYKIMKKMKRPESDIKKALYAAKLYDLGLTQIDDSIVMKSGKLSDIEKRIIMTHPIPGIRLLDVIEPDEGVKNAILHHHERYDGKGYPAGLKGAQIPFISRVLAVVDSYDAMVKDRPYRRAIDSSSALKEIIGCSGSQFDPSVVSAFNNILN